MSISWSVDLEDKVSAPANAAAKAMGEAATKARAMADAVGSAHGPVTALGDHMGNAGHGAEGMGEAVFGAELAIEALKVGAELAVEAVKLTAEAIVELGHFAIESAEGVNLLSSQFEALVGGAEGAGDATLDMLRQLETEVPQSEKVLGSWARSLMAAGVTDMTKLHDSLKAVAGAEALVEGGGEKVRGMLAKLNEASEKGTKVKFSMAQLAGTGVTEVELLRNLGMTPKTFDLARKAGTITGTQIAEAMTKAINAKAAGPLEDQMTEIGTVMTKAKGAIGRLFETIDIKPLVDGVRAFFDLFDAANPSGQALRTFIVGAFDAIFSVAGKVFAFVKTGFLTLIIWGLQAAIMIKTHQTLFLALASILGGVFVAAIVAIAIALVPAAIAAWAFAAGVIAATWPILAIGAAIGLVVFAIYELVKHWGEVKEFFARIASAAQDAGLALVHGLANGIKAGAEFVLDAVKSLGGLVLKGIKAILGIASPSKLMFDVGANVSAGMAQGIEAGAPQVAEAGASMGAAAVPRASGAGGGGGSVTATINVTVEGAGKDAQQIGEAVASMVEEKLASLMNRLSLMDGSAPQPA